MAKQLLPTPKDSGLDPGISNQNDTFEAHLKSQRKGSDCGFVDRPIASHNSGPQFESSLWNFNYKLLTAEKTKINKKSPEKAHLKVLSSIEGSLNGKHHCLAGKYFTLQKLVILSLSCYL